MGLSSFLKAAGEEAFDLFHLVVVAVVVVFLFLEVMDAWAHGWTLDPGFGTKAVLLLGGCAATFPLRDADITSIIHGKAEQSQGTAGQ